MAAPASAVAVADTSEPAADAVSVESGPPEATVDSEPTAVAVAVAALPADSVADAAALPVAVASAVPLGRATEPLAAPESVAVALPAPAVTVTVTVGRDGERLSGEIEGTTQIPAWHPQPWPAPAPSPSPPFFPPWGPLPCPCLQPVPAPPALVSEGAAVSRVAEAPISVEAAPPRSVDAVETSVSVALGRAVAAPVASGNAVSTSVDEGTVEFKPVAVASALADAASCNQCQWS